VGVGTGVGVGVGVTLSVPTVRPGVAAATPCSVELGDTGVFASPHDATTRASAAPNTTSAKVLDQLQPLRSFFMDTS
jgi:hypothetical protein